MPEIHEIPKYEVSLDVPILSKEDMATIETVFRNPSVVRYLKYLESDLLNDFHRIPLTDLLANREHVVLKQAFVMGGCNITQTLLSIHKTPHPNTQPQQGVSNVTGTTRRS